MTRNPNLWHWYHYDYIGNVAATTNQLGNQEDFFHFTYDQDSFGNVYGISNPILGYVYGSENGLAINPLYQKGYHQTTKEYDNRANMYFFNFRWYDPIIGRFISHEPLGIDGTNLYHFTFNNPVNLFDPNGLQVPLYPGWNPPTPTPRPPHPRPVTEFELLHYNMMNHINSAGLSTLSFFDSIYNFPRNYGANDIFLYLGSY
jgi:RHS repeat-associated protein